jgi:hypothetical protein
MATMDFTMYEGDTHTLEVTVRDEEGNVVDITGATVRWWLAKNNKSTGSDIYVQKTTGAGITLVDPTNGRMNIALVPVDTEGRGGKDYYHEAEVDDGGNISTVLLGKATINRTLIP